MKIEKTSMVTGVTRVRDLDITEDQMNRYLKGEELIQNVFPNLNKEEREWLKSGITGEEWDDLFNETEE